MGVLIKFVALFLYILIAFPTSASSQCFWAAQSGGVGEDFGCAIGTDGVGNVYSVGSFTGFADFDPSINSLNLNSSGGKDIYIWKLDGNRNLIWAKKIGGISDDEPRDLFVDSNGDLYLTGYFKSAVDFDPSSGSAILNSNGSKDIFVAKFDSSATLLWAKGFGGMGDDEGVSITIDLMGSLYLTGYFQQTTDFDPGSSNFTLTSNGASDVFVSNFSVTGGFIQAFKFGGALDDFGRSVKTDTDGNLMTVGYYQGTVDFDPGASFAIGNSNGSYDCFLSKYDSAGNFLWSRQFGGNQSDGCNGVDIDDLGNIYIIGFFSGPTDFDPGPSVAFLTPSSGSVGYPDAFICKFNPSGYLNWVGSMGGSNVDVGSELDCDASGNCYLTGRFSGTADLNPGAGIYNLTAPALSPAVYTDAFVCKVDSSGYFNWAKRIGGKQNDNGNSIALDPFDNIYTTGYFSGLSGFDPNALTFPAGFTMTSFGSFDVYISKIIVNEIISQPQDLTINQGMDAIFSVVSNPFANYQWQVRDGNSFINLANSSQYFGVDSDSLFIFNVGPANNLQQYRCLVGALGCSDTSEIALLTVNFGSGIDSSWENYGVSVFPIPAFDYLQMEVNQSMVPTKFSIVDVLGRMVQTGSLAERKIKLDLNAFPQGVYTLVIGNCLSVKFVKLIR